MRTNELIEIAGIVSLQSPQSVYGLGDSSEQGLSELVYRYWDSNRQRFRFWDETLNHLETTYYSSCVPLPDGLFEDIIAGELLSRLTYRWFFEIDERYSRQSRQRILGSVARNVLHLHEAEIERVFQFLLKRETKSTRFRTVWYNQLRRTTQYWARALERYMIEESEDAFAEIETGNSLLEDEISPKESELYDGLLGTFDSENGLDSPNGQGANGAVVMAAPRLCYETLQSALNTSFLLWSQKESVGSKYNKAIADSVLAIIPDEGKLPLFAYPERLEERVVSAADDMQRLLDTCWTDIIPTQDLFLHRLERYAG